MCFRKFFCDLDRTFDRIDFSISFDWDDADKSPAIKFFHKRLKVVTSFHGLCLFGPVPVFVVVVDNYAKRSGSLWLADPGFEIAHVRIGDLFHDLGMAKGAKSD